MNELYIVVVLYFLYRISISVFLFYKTVIFIHLGVRTSRITIDVCELTRLYRVYAVYRNNTLKDKQELFKLTSNIDIVLGSGGFSIKSWVISDTKKKDTDERQRAPLNRGEQKAQVNWHKSDDTFLYKAKLNFSPKNEI